MRAIKINKNTNEAEILRDLKLAQPPTNTEEVIWVDFSLEDRDKERDVLEQQYGIANLAINDAFRDRHPPKYEAFKNYNYLLIKAFDETTTTIDINIQHISFFINKGFLLTVHSGSSPSIDFIWDQIASQSGKGSVDTYSVLYDVLRKIISRYTKVILGLEGRLDEIETKMVTMPTDDLLSELIGYSTKTQYLYRIFNNQDIVVKELLSSDENLKENNLYHKFQDIEEHMHRLAGLTGLLNEVTKNLIDGYISVTGHRLNNIMKTLTIVALIFMPITFLAGIYGMNFEYMPELSYKYGYFIVIGVMVFMIFGLIFIFRKLKWV